MENVTIKDVVLEKKMGEYGANSQNFVAANEITVTITLSEYRDLVEKAATRKAAIVEAEKDKYTRNQENERLCKEIAQLNAKLYEYQRNTHTTLYNSDDTDG